MAFPTNRIIGLQNTMNANSPSTFAFGKSSCITSNRSGATLDIGLSYADHVTPGQLRL
jgi:hypothetical protein